MFYRLPSIARKIIANMNLLGKMSRTMWLCVCDILRTLERFRCGLFFVENTFVEDEINGEPHRI